MAVLTELDRYYIYDVSLTVNLQPEAPLPSFARTTRRLVMMMGVSKLTTNIMENNPLIHYEYAPNLGQSKMNVNQICTFRTNFHKFITI